MCTRFLVLKILSRNSIGAHICGFSMSSKLLVDGRWFRIHVSKKRWELMRFWKNYTVHFLFCCLLAMFWFSNCDFFTLLNFVRGSPVFVGCLWSENGHFCQKCPFLRPKQWHFEEPNQNSKTTFIVQTFPKYGPYDFYFMNLSLLGAILAIFQFCRFSGLFWPFFPCKKGWTENSRLSNEDDLK